MVKTVNEIEQLERTLDKESITFKELKEGILKYKAKSEYQQAAIIIIRGVLKKRSHESSGLHLQSVVCSALSDEVATKMLAHCPYEKSGWCTTELGCRFKLENCDAKGNGCELAL